jgi:hypothetical protein
MMEGATLSKAEASAKRLVTRFWMRNRWSSVIGILENPRTIGLEAAISAKNNTG